MSIQAPTNLHATAPLRAAAEDLILDAASLLDHKTRGRLKTPRLARRGRHLVLQDGEQTLLLELETKITHIGRGLTAHVRLEDARVSRDHAILVQHPRGVRVLDNRSSNGTYVNGRRVLAAELADGDVVRFGPVAVRYLELR